MFTDRQKREKGYLMSEDVRILVVEDEEDISSLMTVHLKREGYFVTEVDNGEDALRSLSQSEHNLVVLDWMLPGVSGIDVCRRVRGEKLGRTSSQVPILMVTARVNPSDIVLGLEMGADDYLTKPFEVPVFLARVRALIRRLTLMSAAESNHFQLGDLCINADSYEVTCGKKIIPLTATEFKILLALIKNQGRVLTREHLIDLVRGEEVNVIDRTIDTHVFGIRKKLGQCAEFVETVRGIGYRIKN